jgi:hypothetical protein
VETHRAAASLPNGDLELFGYEQTRRLVTDPAELPRLVEHRVVVVAYVVAYVVAVGVGYEHS